VVNRDINPLIFLSAQNHILDWVGSNPSNRFNLF